MDKVQIEFKYYHKQLRKEVRWFMVVVYGQTLVSTIVKVCLKCCLSRENVTTHTYEQNQKKFTNIN